MVAAPQYATMILTSKDGTQINVDVYCSDVANALVNFDSGAGSGSASETFYKSPITGFITDFAIKTGMTDTTAGRITVNNGPTKSVIRWANQLNSLNQRPKIMIPISVGENIGIIQLA